ncbi:MAG TPA: hypothetical protein VHB21_01315, partial [Minicystis sp.]|nr:hypothetical protein [Minicystis sp.]
GGGAGGCPAGSHAAGGGCAATLTKWTAGPLLPSARDHHVTFVATTPSGSFLYVAGGTNGFSIFDDVMRAPVQAGGALGGFETTPHALPEGAAGQGLAQLGNAVVLAGGLVVNGSAAVSSKDAFVGLVADDGSVAFTKGPSLAADRYHVSLSEDRGYVYAIGGLRQAFVSGQYQQSVSDAVERAPFDGKKLGAWEALAPLPHALTHQAAVVRDHAIYLVGGLSTGLDALPDILRADVHADGGLGDFKPAGKLPEGRGTSSAFVFLDQLYVLCGATLAQGGEVATVLRAPFLADGSVGTFEELPPVPKPRAHVHQTPLLDGIVYSAGGSAAGAFESDVFLGHFE